MSKRKILPSEDPPIAASSDDDDEAESSSGEYESDSSSEEDDQSASVPVAVTSNKTPAKPASSTAADSDSGSESASGSDSEMDDDSGSAAHVTITSNKTPAKPASSAAADSESGSETESGSDSEEPPKQVALAPPVLKSALKRPAISTAKTVEESDSKKSYFKRVWSEDDEITLLQGMIDFYADKGTSPYDDINRFFDSVKKDFRFGPSKTQFLEKIRGLKKKYRNKGPFTKAHDKKSMGLAKFIWGVGGFAYESDVVKPSNGKAKKKCVKLIEEEEKEAQTSCGEGPEENVPKAALTVTVNNTPVKSAVSGSVSGSESEEDSETEEEPSKPVADTTSAKPKNKEVAAASSPPVLKSMSKRPASEETSIPVKRAKTVLGDVEKSVGEESKKLFFQRVWTIEDEIILLNAMIEFHGKTGNPYEDMDGFFDSVKKDFSFGPTKTQFKKKISGLKKKFLKKKYLRIEKIGDEPDNHDKVSMGLADRIWGPGAFAYESVVKSANGKAKKSEKKSVKPVEEEEKNVLVHARADPEPPTVDKSDWLCETSFVVQSFASHGLDERFVKQNWSLASMEDKKKLEEKYKILSAQEVEYVLLKTEFLHKVSPMVYKLF